MTTQLVAVSDTSGKPCMPLPWNEGNGPEEVLQGAHNGKQVLVGMDLLKACEIPAASGGAVDCGRLVSEIEDGASTTAPVTAADGIEDGAATPAPVNGGDDGATAPSAAAVNDIDGGAAAAAAAPINDIDDTAVAADGVEGSSSSSIMGGLPTAVLVSGANPGMVQHFVKAALWKMAEDCGMATGEGQRLLMRMPAMIAVTKRMYAQSFRLRQHAGIVKCSVAVL
jgi:hypothetical protein